MTYVIHCPSGDSAVLAILFQRPMSARPSTFLVPGSALAAPCGEAVGPVFCWATSAEAVTKLIAQTATKRAGALRYMGSPGTTTNRLREGGSRIYGAGSESARALLILRSTADSARRDY